MTKVNWSLELAVEEEKRRWRRLLATPGPSLVTASQLRTPSSMWQPPLPLRFFCHRCDFEFSQFRLRRYKSSSIGFRL